jgi:outer membrane protein OmpA-like peptidoglycan-associated protein
MRRRLWAIVLTTVLVTQAGCAALQPQRPWWNKPVGKGTWIPAAICSAVGAGSGYLIAENIPGHSCSTVNGSQVCVEDDHNYAAWTAGGAAVGAVLCGVLGHIYLDKGPETTITPPPPPAVEAPPPPPPTTRRRIVLRGITFDFNKYDVRSESRPVLDEACSTLRAESGAKVVVQGYTDSIGTEEYNQALSLRRAEAVYRYLVNCGVAPERLRAVGYGESNPVADNETDSGRAQNRRVELQVE